MFRRKDPTPSDAEESSARLAALVKESGVPEALQRARCEVKTLRPSWRDEEAQSGLLFFLVPQDLESANFGWFTPEELLQWAEGRGVVPKDQMLESLDATYEYARKADHMLEKAGVAARAKCLAAWTSSESRIPGVRVLVATKDQELLPNGTYTLSHLSVMLSLGEEVAVTE